MQGCMRSDSGESGGMDMSAIPFIPLPMAIVGACVAFMFGIMFGKMIARKREMMMMQGGWQGGGQPWMMHHGMKGHHHHGEGSPACQQWHGDWSKPEQKASDMSGDA